MKTPLFAIVSILTFVMVSACSSNPPPKVPVSERLAGLGYTRGEQVKRVTNFQVNSWNMVDRRNAIIYVGASRRYLVTTRSPCDGLVDAQHLGYSTTAGTLTDKDKLLVRRTTGRVESCFIDTIFALQKIEKPSN